MEIDGITLWLFGGVAKFKDVPVGRAEFRIAIAGPLVSLAIGLGCALVAGVRPARRRGRRGRLARLHQPAAARVQLLLRRCRSTAAGSLRSALWKAKGSFGWATTVSANIGRGIGVLMIGAGIFMLIFREQYGARGSS